MGCCGFFGKLAKACDDVDTCDKDHCCETNWMVIILIGLSVLGLLGAVFGAYKRRMAAQQKQREAATFAANDVPMLPPGTAHQPSLAKLQNDSSAKPDHVFEERIAEEEIATEECNEQEQEEEDQGLNAETIAARKAAAEAEVASNTAYCYRNMANYSSGISSSSKSRCNDWIGGSGHPAYLCNSCGFGAKKDNCCVCDKWVAATKYRAQLCTSCGIGAKSDNCSKCGEWCGGAKHPAHLCSDCGFGNRNENCCKMKS